ncbi:MAG TPA: lipid II flippase MurJ [Candidatus Paceibacterota bacterium]|nr:lipid II flippase MurJ [Candidatus Paceibacterota bacterium]
MVRTILKSLTAPVRGLHQAAYLLAGLTLASQVLALLRDRLFAHQFGAGLTLDLYYAAFKVPDLVFALVASLVSAYVLIPRIAGASRDETRNLLSHTASFLFIGGGVLCLGIAWFAPALLSFLFPSLMTSGSGPEFVALTRILLIQPILLGLSGIVTSVTQVRRRFALFALSPVLYNLGIIAGAYFLYPVYGLMGIGYGVIAGAVLHLFIHLPLLARARVLPRPVVPKLSIIIGIAKDSIPRSLALGMGAVSALALAALAASSGEGNVAVYTLASNLEAVPLSLIGASYATAAFPVLAEHMNAKRFDGFKATLSAAARHIIFWSAIISVLMLVLRAHAVRIILGSGAFDWDATRLTAAVLAILVLGLIAQGLVLLCSRAFYAAGKSWNPLLIQAAGAMLSVLAAAGLLHLISALPAVRYFMEALLRVEDVPGTGVLAIAIGAAFGQLVMAVIALVTLRDVAEGVARSLARSLCEGLGAAILGGAAAYGVLSFTGSIAPLTTLLIVFAEAALAGIVGLLVAGAVLALLENREFRDLIETLKKLTSTKALKPHGQVLNDRPDT